MYFKNRPSLTVRTGIDTDEPLSPESVGRALENEGMAGIDYVCDVDGCEEKDFLGFAGSWEDVQELVRRQFEQLFMRGDCWHLALAMNAVLDLPLGGVGRMYGDAWVIDHVFAYLGDGTYLDIRGVHKSFESLISYRPDHDGYFERPVTVGDIVNELDGFARDEGCEPLAWTDPQQYEFASFSRQLVSALEFERHVPARVLAL